jgi:enediyne polyketide synthase
MSTARDPDLLLFGASEADELRERLAALEADGNAPAGSGGDADPPADAPLRAALLIRDPSSLGGRIARLREWLDEDLEAGGLRASHGVFLGAGRERPRIGFLFPGQGAPVYTEAGAIGRHFPAAAQVFEHAGLPSQREDVPKELLQVTVIAGTLAALVAMEEVGIEADVGVGHSMGELSALHWAGSVDEAGALDIARAGAMVASHASADGTMATVLGDEETFRRVVDGTGVAAAAWNSPTQRVVSGRVEAIQQAMERARELGARALPLRVTGAYHTPAMWDAVPDFQAHLEKVPMDPPRRRVISTVTAEPIGPDTPLRDLMVRQFCQPVRFMEAASRVASETGLLIEVGPGKMLAGLVSEFAETPAVATRVGAASSYGLFETAAAAYAAGAPVRLERLLRPNGRTASPSAATA